MYRKLILAVIALFTLAIVAACSAPAAPATQESAEQAAPAATEEEATEEEATEEPAEEAEATEAAAEEAVEAAEATEEAAEESAADAVTYEVDTDASTIAWYGSKPIGASESGLVQISEGQLNFAGSELIDGTIIIDMTTIETDSQSGNMAEMLVGHLMSDDFFGVETYPTATLVLKSVTPTDVENQYAVVGDLTIKETTDEIEFLTNVTVGDGTLEAVADIVVDRARYDVQYGSGSFFTDLGDDLISDEMEMTVTLVASS